MNFLKPKLSYIAVLSAILLPACGGDMGSSESMQTHSSVLLATTGSVQSSTFVRTRSNYSITRSGSDYVVTDLVDHTIRPVAGSIQSLIFADVSVNLGIYSKANTAIPPADLNTLIELYIAYFNRVPSADGLSYWIDQMLAGMTLEQIGESFYEVGVQYSDLTRYSLTMQDVDFVKLVYKNVLGRTDPTQSGLDYWTGNLANGTQTRGTLIQTMLAAAHTYKGDPAYGWVADLLDNKVTVAKYFAIQQGLSYLTGSDAITYGMAIGAAITPTDILTAETMVPVSDASFNLGNIGPTPTTNISWSVIARGDSPGTVDFTGIKFGNGRFVALGNNRVGTNALINGPAISSSVDGITWTAQSVNLGSPFATLTSIAYGQGKFVALSNYGDIVTSTDGLVWSVSTQPYSSVVYGGGIFMAIGGSLAYSTSSDGIHWSAAKYFPEALESFGSAIFVKYANGKFILGNSFDNSVYVSVDAGDSWNPIVASYENAPTDMILENASAITYGNGVYVADIFPGYAGVSHDMSTWTLTASNVCCGSFAFLDNLFVITVGLSDGINVMTSADGSTWHTAVVANMPAGYSGQIYDMDFGNGIFVGIGQPQLLVRGVIGS